MTANLTGQANNRHTHPNRQENAMRENSEAGVTITKEVRYRQILQSMEEAYFETNMEGNLTFFTESFCELFGRRREEMGNIHFSACLSPDEAPKLSNAFDEVLKTLKPSPKFTCVAHKKDGSPAMIEVSFRFLRDRLGKPAGFSGMARDVTETIGLKQALKESEDNYHKIMESSPYSVTIINAATGRYVQVSKGFCQHTGYSAEEAIGRTPGELKLFKDPSDERIMGKTLRRDGQIDGLEMKVQSKDGRVYSTLISARLISFKGAECFLSIATDITPIKETQRALQESEEGYRSILETAPYTILVTRRSDAKYMEANTAFCRRTGYTREETIGHTALELNIYESPTDRQRLSEAFNRDGKVEHMEFRFRAKDGRLLEDLLSATPIRYKGEECVLIMSVDVGEVKKAQKALRESEESHRTILKSAPYSIIITRLSDSRYMQVNDAFCRRTGYSREEAVGHTPYELNLFVDPTERDRILEIFYRDGRVDSMNVQFRAKDGHILESLFSITPISYKGEDCLLAMTVDIGELKKAQRALAERERKYSDILKNMEEGYWEVDLRGSFTYANEAEGRLHQCSPAELIGRNNRTFSNPETANKVYKIFNEVYRTGIPAKIIDYEVIREDGTVATLEISASLLKDASGKPMGFFGVSRDITEKKKAEKELESYRQHLEEMVRARTKELEDAQSELVRREKLSVLGQLTATVSHELRNPLGVIRSSNFFLQRKVTEKDDRIDKHFKRIEEQVTLCDTIVADLLEYTRGRSASMVTTQINSWLTELLNQGQEMGSIDLKRSLPGDLPPIPHDPEKMRRVMVNLIDNALQAVKAKQASLKENEMNYRPVVCVSTKRDGGLLVLEVRDNGIGMNEETRRHAFEPLFTTRARGTGIGLANVKKIVSEHNGTVSLGSEPGKGTTVVIRLPCPPGQY